MTINFEALQAPIQKHLVKQRVGRGNQKFDYITSRVVMDRLDTVCGPANWRNEFSPSLAGEGVQCTIYIRIDGEWVGKSDVGSESNIEEEKGAYSDALKRAAVHWGIARELYGDLPVAQTPEPRQPSISAPRNGGSANTSDTTLPESELDAHFGLLVNGTTWGEIAERLVADGLADNAEFHAFGRLKKIAADLPDFKESNPFPAIMKARWTEQTLIEKFKERVLAKTAQEATK